MAFDTEGNLIVRPDLGNLLGFVDESGLQGAYVPGIGMGADGKGRGGVATWPG